MNTTHLFFGEINFLRELVKDMNKLFIKITRINKIYYIDIRLGEPVFLYSTKFTYIGYLAWLQSRGYEGTSKSFLRRMDNRYSDG